MRGKVQPKTAFDAQIAIVRRGIKGRFHAENLVILDLQIHLATDTAVGAGGFHGAVSVQGGDH
jgi:hypothetical protein